MAQWQMITHILTWSNVAYRTEHINDGDYDDHDFDDTESMLDPDAERDDSSLKKLRWSNASRTQMRKKREGADGQTRAIR